MVDLTSAAEHLRNAYAGEPIAPLRGVLAPDDAEAAYQVQKINTDFWVNQGRRIAGRKIGLTSPAVQKQLGVDQPDYGVLFTDMQIDNNGVLDPQRAIQPKVEAEVAFVLATDLNEPDCTAEQMESAVAYARPAIEIVDSRIADWKITFADTVADNGSSAFFVLGDEKKEINGLDLYSCGMVLEINGKVASIGAGAACLGHPLNAAAWLARTLSRQNAPLRAGDILLTGALGPMAPLSAGDGIKAHIGGLGCVSFSYG